ncbi:methyl methanesulfonate-sensitivity protein 22 [Stemphylium lycopersici]|nr:methyl methanesulfonate-sensitivity protein 22 [Stemphylium lycopersici]
MASTYSQQATPPASSNGTTCRRVQMSKWRQKGFVQDSDEEEEESQLESQGSRPNAGLSRRVERVEDGVERVGQNGEAKEETQSAEEGRGERHDAAENMEGIQILGETITTPTKPSRPSRPTPSPFTPKSTYAPRPSPSESPDPLQSSPTPKPQRIVQPSSFQQRPEPPTLPPSSIVSIPQLDDELAIPSQAAGGPNIAPENAITGNAGDPTRASNILNQFGIGPLSDNSDDDDLSDPPTDMESPPTAFVMPHRRTAVQVLIPSSTALQRELAIADERARRDFRQRKPIQLHPYALEGERYRREVQSRGLKPVRRERSRSPQGHRRQQNDETQEQDFNPDENPMSSPTDVEIPVSTPTVARPRKGVQETDPLRRPASASARRPPSTQLRHPHAAKRRKFNVSSTQAVAPPTSISKNPDMRRDIWSIPPNSPPYSSSPPRPGNASTRRPAMLRATTPAPNLPTPSTSSVIQDDMRPLMDSDSDPAPRSVQRSGGALRRPARVVLTESSSSATDSASEAEQSDNELKHVGKRIKGVLPASWLRFDRQTQERRKAQQRERERARANAALSPEPTAPVRGVAQRVMKPHGRLRQSPMSNTPSRDLVVISDESDDELRAPVSRPVQNVHDSVADVSALAAIFDNRYAEDDNLSDMEHDRLHLPTLGGTGPTRKRQSKLTDAFSKAKKVRSSNALVRTSGHGKESSGGRSGKKKKNGYSKKAGRATPPAMSVIDVDLSPSGRNGKVPQFLRVARRQALSRPDLARQSPRTKQIRLHNAEDTGEANVTLQQWQQGTIKPKPNISSRRRKPRPHLADRAENQQHTEWQSMADAGSAKASDRQSEAGTEATRSRQRQNISTGLHIFQRSSVRKATARRQEKSAQQPSIDRGRPRWKGPLPYRTAQLEGDENDFGRDHRKIAFEKGLLRVDQQFGNQLPNEHHIINPQIARYLADDTVELPPLPSATDVGERPVDVPSEPAPTVKRRLKRKVQAQRIDVDAREFRQPSEPTIQEILGTTDVAEVQEPDSEQGLPVLQGLAPYGTRYPITFDVYSLASETYFHSSTLVGSDAFSRALNIGKPEGRDLDDSAGYSTITHGSTSVRCGPWSDETFSILHDVVRNVSVPTALQASTFDTSTALYDTQMHLSRLARSFITYVSDHLSFLDPIDRRDFVVKVVRLCQTLHDGTLAAQDATNGSGAGSHVRTMAYLLVLSLQLHHIAQHPTVDPGSRIETMTLAKNVSKTIVTHLVRQGIPVLSNFLEQNKRHSVREKGVQDSEVIVESTVICMHVLEKMNMPAWGFWELVSQELSPMVTSATHLSSFETTWASLFTFLPFSEIDASGMPLRSRRETFQDDNWACIRDILRRMFELYPATYRKQSTSLNDYVRANLTRCHRLMTHWHWRRPELMLNAALDFFGKSGLKGLRREESKGSVSFLNDLATDQALTVEPNEYSFHVILKCLALGLHGMRDTYPEKKIRSFVFRSLPNHGRAYPKDQPLDQESLTALRNHHDLLSTLYWGAPPACRPKLDHIRDLVSHESSHREACRLNVRAWANLATFQLSTEEPYTSAKPFALWHKDIMHQTLRQYKLAKTEAEDYLKSGVLDGTTDISAVMVRQAMERNQEQVIATLRDCIAGMSKVIRHARDQSSLRTFLVDSEMMHLLELPHLEDRRLINVIHDTLKVLQDYAKSQKAQSKKEESQQISEESQDYGDFPDMDDLEDMDIDVPTKPTQQSGLDFIQTPLWHLLSNAFGAESAPDDILLKDCVDTWVRVAEGQVASGERSWSYYLDSFSQVSWKQLRQTEQTRKFGPYFMAALIDCGSTVYEEHRNDFLQALMVCLVERESMLRFQHQLLHAILRADDRHPLMQNLPFFRDLETGAWDINADTLRTRRLALISSMLSNMRSDMHTTALTSPTLTAETKRFYASVLKDFMTSMKYNYQRLSQGTTVTGTYVEFVQKVVQFLKQYTSDINPVLPFFTDSVAFPLPAADPTYVVARLCGYAPKLGDPGTAKQLAVFVQTVAQQAAADTQQTYLVNQLTTALCTNEAPTADRLALRSVLLQAIFPAYIEEMLASPTAFLIARPVLAALPAILKTMVFDLRVACPDSLAAVVGGLVAVAHAFIRGTEGLVSEAESGNVPTHAHVLAALAYMQSAMEAMVPPLEYICSRTIDGAATPPPFVTYADEFVGYISALLDHTTHDSVPRYSGDAHAPPHDTSHANLLSFSRRGLAEGLKTNWSESAGRMWFGSGHARREVLLDVGGVEEEKERLGDAVRGFRRVLGDVYGVEEYRDVRGCNMGYNVVV